MIGNRLAPAPDWWDVRCEECREALSARLDGEAEPDPAVDAHVAGCAECREWEASARELRRAMLLRPAPRVPDLTASILERTPAPPSEGWGLRIALALVAVAQLGLAFAQLLDTHDLAAHLGHESGAWNLAVGIGLLAAALRPKTASGQLPLLSGFVLVLLVLSAGDLLAGRVTLARLATHLLVVAGLALLWAVSRAHRNRTAPLPAATADEPGVSASSTSTSDGPARPRPRPFRRQAHGRHAA